MGGNPPPPPGEGGQPPPPFLPEGSKARLKRRHEGFVEFLPVPEAARVTHRKDTERIGRHIGMATERAVAGTVEEGQVSERREPGRGIHRIEAVE